MFDTKALAQATALIVREHVDAAVAPLLERIAALEARVLVLPEKGEPGRDGKDADMAVVRELIVAEVAQSVAIAVAALPPAEKGAQGERGEPGERGPQGERGSDGADGAPGKDGVGLAGMMIDRDGEAVATLTDGTLIKLGPVVGRDGKDGAPGEAGRDGRDGQDLSDIQVTQDGAVLELAFQIGEQRSIYEIELPAGPAGENGKDAYPGEAKGLYDPAAIYRAMDVVSFNGSEWRVKYDNPGELPGPGWMLSASKGKRGERGEKGPAGRDGVTIVAQYIRGDELVTTLSDGMEFTSDLSELIQKD